MARGYFIIGFDVHTEVYIRETEHNMRYVRSYLTYTHCQKLKTSPAMIFLRATITTEARVANTLLGQVRKPLKTDLMQADPIDFQEKRHHCRIKWVSC
jgi:hypothetical protein